LRFSDLVFIVRVCSLARSVVVTPASFDRLASSPVSTRGSVVRCAAAALEAPHTQRVAIEAAALLISKLARSKELLLDLEAVDAVALVTSALHSDTMADGDPFNDADRRPTIKALALALRSLLRARLCVCARGAAAEAEKNHRAAVADATSASADAAAAAAAAAAAVANRTSASGAIFRGDSRYLSLSARSMVENVYAHHALPRCIFVTFQTCTCWKRASTAFGPTCCDHSERLCDVR
jgi:hypothetical protein